MEWLDQLEDRIEKPGYLLYIVMMWMFFVIGFVNLISHESGSRTIFNYYSVRQIFVLAVYLAGLIYWTSLFWQPNNDTWLRSILRLANQRWYFLLVFFAFSAILTMDILTHPRWLVWPALGTSLLGIMLITGAMLIFYKESPTDRFTWIQTGIQYIFGGLILLEIVMQLLSLGGLISGFNTERRALASYDRIYYQSEEVGTINKFANSYGQNVPDFRLDDDSHRIALVGDANLMALPIDPEAHFGTKLDTLINENAAADAGLEAITLGHPDFGTGVFLWHLLFKEYNEELEFNEAIVFIDLNNDFQTISASDNYDVFIDLDLIEEENVVPFEISGEPNINASLRHDYAHEMLWGLEGLQPGRFMASHYMTGRVAGQVFNLGRPADEYIAGYPRLEPAVYEAAGSDISLPNDFLFYADSSAESIDVMLAQLDVFKAYLDQEGIEMKLVTIPVFSDEFYNQPNSDEWTTTFGEADLLLPEQALQAYAADAGIDFLGMGSYLQGNKLSIEDVRGLYFEDGHGLLNESGHNIMAAAITNCFYTDVPKAEAGCETR